MRGLIKTRFIPIKVVPFMDSSLIFQGITEEIGTISLLAKGYKRPKSKIRGEIDIFSVSHVHFYLKDTREVHTIRDARLITSFNGFIHEYESVRRCSEIGKVTLKTSTPDTAKSMFALYEGLLSVAHERRECNAELYYGALLKILHLQGLFPGLTTCVKCESSTVKYISPKAGGPLCEKCAGLYPDRILINKRLIKEIFFLMVRDFKDIATFTISADTIKIILLMVKEHLYENQEDSI